MMPKVENSAVIKGVQIVRFDVFGDDRGRFRETFRREWFPQRSWDKLQTNMSESKTGVLRGLHYHFHQVDYWVVTGGKIRAALYDLRPDSPTAGAAQTVELGGEAQLGIFIPIGVAHGFVSLTDAVLIYVVDNYYTGGDEYGVAWNDPALGVDWGVESPLVSERDRSNPFLKDIPSDLLPSG
jgi:dTDP-4-dehydrorhamnose 3,5-epimerase